MKLLRNIIEATEEKLTAENNERRVEDLPLLSKLEIKLLGQFSILADEDLAQTLSARTTFDVDAFVRGDYLAKRFFLEALKQYHLVFDELSSEIWIPAEATFISVYDSAQLSMLRIDPISALVSKAIKAKEKNRILLKRALAHFGSLLAKQIEKYGGDIAYFLAEEIT